MELFAIAGLMLPPAGGGKRVPAGGRSLRVPLFNHDVVESALQRAAFAPSPEERAAAAGYARAARAKGFTKKTESAVRGLIRDVFVRVLGYTPLDPEALYTLAEERPVRRGAVDIGLGRFDDPAGIDELVAPLEIKGPGPRTSTGSIPGGGAARCSRPGTTPWTRPAHAGCSSRTGWSCGSTASAAGGTPTRSSISPASTTRASTRVSGCCWGRSISSAAPSTRCSPRPTPPTGASPTSSTSSTRACARA